MPDEDMLEEIEEIAAPSRMGVRDLNYLIGILRDHRWDVSEDSSFGWDAYECNPVKYSRAEPMEDNSVRLWFETSDVFPFMLEIDFGRNPGYKFVREGPALSFVQEHPDIPGELVEYAFTPRDRR